MFTRLIALGIGMVFFLVVLTVRPGVDAQPRQSAPLPEGEGKELVEATCTACHPTDQITRSSGYTREGWRALILTMVEMSAMPELETLSAYLARHFPAQTHLQPTLVPGDATIAFREWQVPTLGQRARDPVQAPDGSI